MKWNDENGFILFNSSLHTVESILGISQIDYIIRCELAPYVTYILDYLAKRLIMLGDGLDIKAYIQEIFDIYDWGADNIVNGTIKDMLVELGIDDSQETVEEEEIPYNQDRFVFSWSNVLTALVVRLKFQYSSLLAQPIDTDCPCDECGNTKGQTTEDFENWQSGVFPEDDSYSWYNYSDDGTTWRVTSGIPECTKCSRTFTRT